MKLKPADFIARVAPVAVQLRLEGSPIFPSLRIAQAAHETGWRIHSWNNLVGLKAGGGKPNQYWDGSSVRTGTWEVINGQRIDTAANWRAYRSVEDCFRDQDLLFALPRYERVRQARTSEEQAEMLQACGYATDPQYAAKLKTIIKSHGLKQFDEEAKAVMQAIEELNRRITDLGKRMDKLAGEIRQLSDENRQMRKHLGQLERIPAPPWFVDEFGSPDLDGLIRDPQLTFEAWRALAVALRVQKQR